MQVLLIPLAATYTKRCLELQKDEAYATALWTCLAAYGSDLWLYLHVSVRNLCSLCYLPERTALRSYCVELPDHL